jgi:hypothetical protein
VLPEAEHLRTGLHRATSETTKPIERSHVFTRDWSSNSLSLPSGTDLPHSLTAPPSPTEVSVAGVDTGR